MIYVDYFQPSESLEPHIKNQKLWYTYTAYFSVSIRIAILEHSQQSTIGRKGPRFTLPETRPDSKAVSIQLLQASQVDNTIQKAEYKQAGQEILAQRTDLGLMRQDPNPDFLTKKGVKRGIAEHLVSDIDYWIENVKSIRPEE